MLTDTQKRNYEFFRTHLDEYLANPLLVGKVGVFHDERFVKAFDNFENAARFAFDEFNEGFVIQDIIDETKFINYNRWAENQTRRDIL